nr:MAG TPA: hypothetical protein [Caudoviricetes sp.]
MLFIFSFVLIRISTFILPFIQSHHVLHYLVFGPI